jgi:hypothetical protein
MDGELVAEYRAAAAASAPEKEYGYRDGQLLIAHATNHPRLNRQPRGRKAGLPDAIESVEKSKQRADSALKKIRSIKDLEDQ